MVGWFARLARRRRTHADRQFCACTCRRCGVAGAPPARAETQLRARAYRGPCGTGQRADDAHRHRLDLLACGGATHRPSAGRRWHRHRGCHHRPRGQFARRLAVEPRWQRSEHACRAVARHRRLARLCRRAGLRPRDSIHRLDADRSAAVDAHLRSHSGVNRRLAPASVHDPARWRARPAIAGRRGWRHGRGRRRRVGARFAHLESGRRTYRTLGPPADCARQRLARSAATRTTDAGHPLCH